VTGVRTGVVTIVRDRAAHLDHVLAGLAGQTQPPDAVTIVVMGGEDPEGQVRTRGLPVTFVHLDVPGDGLPLAAARNVGAESTEADVLVLLDVDCIPGAELVAGYAAALAAEDLLLMGEVRYLGPGATDDDPDEATLHGRSRPHPARTAPRGDGPVRTDAYELFWSLSFAVRRDTFLTTIGGFDPELDGYGGEDTDLAFAARAAGVPLAWLPGAVAYHQYHDTYDPPLPHLTSIVRNARTFRDKWGTWPMGGWLRGFDDLGVVRFDEAHDELEVLRPPTDAEIAAARRTSP
jgi:GT2 family glycosyltransferase